MVNIRNTADTRNQNPLPDLFFRHRLHDLWPETHPLAVQRNLPALPFSVVGLTTRLAGEP
jgi:hypothetical protein